MTSHTHEKTSEAYDVGPYGTIRYGRDEMTQHEHPIASGADPIEPGMLVERVAEGGEIHVQPHSTAGSVDNLYIAIEARGRGMNALDGEYAEDGDQYVRYVHLSGGGMNVLLGAGETATVGDTLTSGGDGTFVVFDSGAGHEDKVLDVATPVDNSGGTNAVFTPSEVI